MHKRLRKISYQ